MLTSLFHSSPISLLFSFHSHNSKVSQLLPLLFSVREQAIMSRHSRPGSGVNLTNCNQVQHFASVSSPEQFSKFRSIFLNISHKRSLCLFTSLLVSTHKVIGLLQQNKYLVLKLIAFLQTYSLLRDGGDSRTWSLGEFRPQC